MPMSVQSFLWGVWPIQFLERCWKRYGDFFTVSFAMLQNAVMIVDPPTIKEIFRGDPDELHAGEGNRILRPVLGSQSVLLLDGPEHMRERKLMLPPFHGERMKRYGEMMAEITSREMERWPVGAPFRLHSSTRAITLDVILKAVFGIEEEARLARFRELLGGMLDTLSTRAAQLALLIRRERVVQLRRFRTLIDAVDAAILEEIRTRRADPGLSERDDILSMLLQAEDEDGNPMSDGQLRDELMTLLTAGHETTATALAWAFERLMRHPDAVQRLKRELSSNGDGYLDAVIQESQRLRPVIPLVARKLQSPMELKEWSLPAGTILSPNIYLTHRRPDVYPEPEAFKPERFLENPPDTYSWLPFGGGVRRCLGASFALYEMKVVLRTILERAELRPVDPADESITRRSITFAPSKGATAVLEASLG